MIKYSATKYSVIKYSAIKYSVIKYSAIKYGECKLTEIIFEHVKDFSLEHIFECGQAFRWEKTDDGSYSGVVSGALANISFSPDAGQEYAGRLVVRVCGTTSPGSLKSPKSAEFWTDYLDLSRDYGEIKRKLTDGDEVMIRAAACGAGIRILNQDPWETLISFIISQNNHIPRIKGCVESLCRHFGERFVMNGGGEYFAFPDIERLAERLSDYGVQALEPCRLGYRARYIEEAVKQVSARGGADYLESLKQLSFEQACKEVSSIHGVGPKVASCVLLFGLGKREGFPVDVWIARAMSEFYGLEEDDKAAAKAYAERRFGEHAGIAQQYLFYYARSQK
ncbi:MAG: 8-oxoguanine DNA glycosylase [Clostridiales Family XIII bacterium]|nr:8-oxoguanine DNA glycosylase [Clostridiales Family XIII bacterium]